MIVEVEFRPGRRAKQLGGSGEELGDVGAGHVVAKFGEKVVGAGVDRFVDGGCREFARKQHAGAAQLLGERRQFRSFANADVDVDEGIAQGRAEQRIGDADALWPTRFTEDWFAHDLVQDLCSARNRIAMLDQHRAHDR